LQTVFADEVAHKENCSLTFQVFLNYNTQVFFSLPTAIYLVSDIFFTKSRPTFTMYITRHF